MRILVTGGAGFIGSHLTDTLLDDGHEVTVLDDFSTGKLENLVGAVRAGATLHRVDVRLAAATREVVEFVAPAAIFHLAAQVDVCRSVADPGADLRTNVGGTINVLEAARAVDARVVNVSSGAAVYGDVDRLPTPETVAPRPVAPYGHSKLSAEGYVRLYGELFGLRTVTARLGNVYGPRQDPLGEAGVIATFCGLLPDGAQPLVFGSGRQTRDFVHVEDVVRGLLALLARPAAEGAFNLGTGVPTSVLDLVALLAPFAHASFASIHVPRRLGEVEHSCLDVERARRELDWTAEVTLAEGIERTVRQSDRVLA